MSSQKRGGGYSHYGDRNRSHHNHHAHQHPNKKQRPNQPAHHSNHGRGPQYVLTNTIPEPELSSADMHSGLVALLDRFVAAETTPNADREILEHASELRRLLSERRVHTPSASAKQDLDKKRPDNGAKVVIPPYVHRKVREATELPPLPPITESHILEAVFTHQSVHQTNLTDHNGINLGLDYERFELLGDAYIELMATRALYNRFPQVDIPQLSSWRERLVENLTLGKFAEAYGFPDRLKAKAKWDKDTKAWKKVVADIFEAYVAGLVLSDPEHGFDRAEEWLDTLWAPQLLTFKEKVVENARARDDLQKLIFLNTVKIEYREERPMTYENGAQRYFIGIYFTGWDYKDEWLGSGEGQNKAAAAIAAATDAIKRNNKVLQGATRKKAELMEVKAKEREEAKKKAAASEAQEDRANAESADAAPTNADESTNKRDNEDNTSEKKKKKHKTEKKRKASADE